MANAVPVPRNHLFPPGPCEIAVGTFTAAGGRPGALGSSVGVVGTGHLGLAGIKYEFLGTTREGGRAQEIVYTGNIPGDYAGSDGMPADIRLSGKGVVVVCQVQNFNPFVMRRLKSRYFGYFNSFGTSGLVDSGDIGGFLLQEYRYVSLAIRSLNSTSGKYPNNDAGLWVPICFPSGEMGWDFAAREQVYSLTFLGITYVNSNFIGSASGSDTVQDYHNLGSVYNQGVLYSTTADAINSIFNNLSNPSS